MGLCDSAGKLLYPSGDMYFGQHRGFIKEGFGKIIYMNGSIYEGGWENDRKAKRGRMYDKISGDIYNGEYLEGKRNGRGRMYYASIQEIYDGDWSNDRRQGEGVILNRRGEISSGEFRADFMEGKSTYQKTLSQSETTKIFSLFTEANDVFILVEKSQSQTQLGLGLQTKAEIITKTFNSIRKSNALLNESKM